MAAIQPSSRFRPVSAPPRQVPRRSVRDFLEGRWGDLLAGRTVLASIDEIDDPGDCFEWFEPVAELGLATIDRYRMPLRDGSRVCADVDRRRGLVRFRRDRHDPAAGITSLVRYALRESRVARTCIAAFRLRSQRERDGSHGVGGAGLR